MLEVSDLTKQFGGLTAVNNLSFNIGKGEIVGLIGPNGAGKTTVFNLLSGFCKPSQGDILFQGKRILRMKPNRIAIQGLVRTFQLVNLVKSETVLANLLVGTHLQRRTGLLANLVGTRKASQEEHKLRARAQSMLDELGLGEVKDERVDTLPHGLQKAVGIAMALAAKPRMVLLDEPTAGMSAVERSHVTDLIRRTRDSGVTVMLIEHDLKMVMGVCDRVLVMNFGSKVSEGSPEEVSKDKVVIEAYLGFDKR